MALSKEHRREANDLAIPKKFRARVTLFGRFIGYPFIPLCIVIWMEFFNAPEKVGNVLYAYLLVSICLIIFLQIILLLWFLSLAFKGDEIVAEAIKVGREKGIEKKDIAKNWATIRNAFRTTIVTYIHMITSISFIFLVIYADYVFFGVALAFLFITNRVLRMFMRLSAEDILVKHFLTKTEMLIDGEYK